MFDLKAYEHTLIDYEVTDKEVAAIMGITTETLKRKKSGAGDFYRNEIQAFKEALNLTTEATTSIFFADSVS